MYFEVIRLIKIHSKCFDYFDYLQTVDWWSLGVLTYELLTGASPFTVEGESNTQSEISRLVSVSLIPYHFIIRFNSYPSKI